MAREGSTSGPPEDGGRSRNGASDEGAEAQPSSFFGEVARALGETAGRTKDRLRSLTERGAIHLAVKKIEKEKREKLGDLGEIARETLASVGGRLESGDPRVSELLRALDRSDEKIERLSAEAEGLKGPSEQGQEEDGEDSARER